MAEGVKQAHVGSSPSDFKMTANSELEKTPGIVPQQKDTHNNNITRIT